MLNTGISMSGFVLAMIPLVFALFLIGYFIYIRKIPKGGEDQDIPVDKKEEWMNGIKWFAFHYALDAIEYEDIGKLMLLAMKKIRQEKL